MSWDDLIALTKAYMAAVDNAGQPAISDALAELFARPVEESLAALSYPATDPEQRARQQKTARFALTSAKIMYAGNILTNSSQRDDDRQFERALAALDDALAAIVSTDSPEIGVSVAQTLASAYLVRQQGDPVENRRHAVAVLERALPLATEPQDAFALQTTIADIHLLLIDDVGDEAADAAIAACAGAGQLARRMGNAELWAQTRQKLGRAHLKKGAADEAAFKLALEAFGEALTVYSQKKHPEKWAELQLNIGDACLERHLGDRKGNLRKAVTAYQNALSVLNRDKRPVDWARATVNLSVALGNDLSGDATSRRRSALDMMESALKLMSEERDPQAWANARSNQGILYLDLTDGDLAKNLESAIAAFKAAQDIFVRRNNKYPWAAARMNLAIAYTRRIEGDPTENKELALEAINDALSVFTQQRSPELFGRAQSILGETYLNRLRGSLAENLDAAITAFRAALAMPLAERESYVRAALGIALLRRRAEVASANDRGDLDAGIAELEAAANKLGRARDPFAWAGIQHTLGTAYKDQGRWPDAIGAYADALKVFRPQSYPRQRADVLANMANLMGECAATSLAGQTEPVREAVTALIYRLTTAGDAEYAALLKVLQEVALIAPAVVAGVGADNAERARQLTLVTELQVALWNEAIASLPAGVDDRRRSDFMVRLAAWQIFLGQFDDAAGLLENALALREALVTETLTRENVFDIVSRTSGVGETLAYCRIKLGQRELGLEQLERAQAAELRRMLASELRHVAALDAEHRAAFLTAQDRLRRLQYEFSRDAFAPGAQRSGAEIAADIRAAQAALRAALGDDVAQDGVEPALSARDILALAPRNGLVIVPLVTFAGGAAYVIPGGVTAITKDNVVELPELTGRAVEDRLSKWRRGYQSMKARADLGDPQAWRRFEPIIEDTLGWLWDAVMQPVLEHAREAGCGPALEGEIIILATGGLSCLPLHAAWNRAVNIYLLDDHVVTSAPSFYALRACRQRAQGYVPSGNGFVGVFDPQQDNPHANLELSATFEWPQLRRAFQLHGARARELIGSAATAANLRQESRQGDYLHLSCHNEFDWLRPERSGVVLAGGEVMDLRQIAGELRLEGCRLVSIAACETAITAAGKLASEQFGLPAAFIQAGAPAVIATLWPVMDWSTAVIMARMYDLLLADHPGPAAALRQAVLEFRDGRLPPAMLEDVKAIGADLDHRLPFFWAPFVTIGE